MSSSAKRKMRSVLAVAVGLVVAVGNAAAGNNKPLFEDHIAVPLPVSHTHRGYTGDIAQLKDGSLLLVYAAPPESPNHGGIVGRRSADGGRTWDQEFLVQANAAKIETIAANLERLATGELLLGYLLINNYQGANHRLYDGHYYVRRSSDDGRSWSHPICVTIYPGFHNVNPDRIFQLRSGRIIVPTEWSKAVGGGEAGHMVSLCYYSDDGHIWLRGQNYVDVGSTTEEPSVVELSDDRLLMVFRNKLGYVGRAYSEDKGDTWSDPKLLDLTSSLAPQKITRIPGTGHLLLLWCNNSNAPAMSRGKKLPLVKVAQLKLSLGELRSPLTAAVSRDQGRTWEHVRNIAQDSPGSYGDYGYPGLTWIEGGTVAVVNYHALDGLHVARIGADWFYGK